MPELTLRPALVADAEEIARVQHESWSQAYKALLSGDFPLRSEGERVALWQQRLQEHPCHTLLAEQSGALVGFVYWLAGAALEAQLRSLYLHPFFWRQGIGSALLRQAMGDMRHEGQRRVGLWVLANNVRAERFYLSQGFYYDGQQQSKGSGRAIYLQRRMVRAL